MSALATLFAKYILRPNSGITIDNVPPQIKDQVQQLLDEAKEVEEDNKDDNGINEDNRRADEAD